MPKKNKAEPLSEFERFRQAVSKVVSVSGDEVKEKIELEKSQRKASKK